MNIEKELTDERIETDAADNAAAQETPESTGDELKRTIISDYDNTEEYPYEGEGYTKARRRYRYKGNLAADICYVAAALLIAMIIGLIFFRIGSAGKKSEELVSEEYDIQIASSSKYDELIKNIEKTKEGNDELVHERDQRQEEYDALMKYSENSWEIDQRIESLQKELDKLNADNAAKQERINELTGEIKSTVASIVNLAPGEYTVGESITAGKYIMTGSGSVLISSSAGKVKLNKVLSADGIEVTLDDKDKIKLDTKAKFSPVQ